MSSEKDRPGEKDRAAESRAAGEVPTAPEPQQAPTKADARKAQDARSRMIASEKFVTNHAVGDHPRGAVVERSKFGKFVDEKGQPDQAAYDANLGRLLDAGAIAPAPDDDKSKE